ncbi:hypothetical protein JCM11641_004172 [Rhodosporidiobolus odoratus]
MPSALVPISGRPLFVETTGTGPPFLALHGLGGSTNLFPLADALGEKYTVIRFDFEGSGKSPLTVEKEEGGGKLGMEGFVEDVKGVLEWAGKGGEKAIVFGHSMGSLVALHFAAKYPELGSNLILSCPSPARAGDPAAVQATLDLARMSREKTPMNMADFTANKNTAPNASLLARTLIRTVMQESSPSGYAKTCEMLARTPSPEWDRIGARVLVIAGNEDKISSVEAAERVAACLTSADSVKLVAVDAGHQPAVEIPEVVLSLLSDFLP